MTETAGAEKRAYGGYFNSARPPEDSALTQVGPATPGGEYLRRFWHPVAMTAEVGERPLKIRIMGEDLVLFRDKGGRYGLLHLHCAHRGTSLEFAIPQMRGLRCCYHGWTYDVDGACLETPGEPPHSKLRETIFQGAYPVREFKGLVFAYMGPPEELPDFPLYDTLIYPEDDEVLPYSLDYACNWLQSHENGADPIHGSFLHAQVSGVQFTPAFGELPVIDNFETPLGMVSSATRRIGDNLWIRAADLIMPNSAQFGSQFSEGTDRQYARASFTRWCVPVDDTHNLTIGYRHFNQDIDPWGRGRRDDIGRNKLDMMGQTPARPRADRQREPGDYEALVGQGAVAVHGAEHHGSTDKGVLMLRRLLRQGIKAVQMAEPFTAPRLDGREVIATYNHHIVHPVPQRTGTDDRELLGEFGRRVGEIVLGSDASPAGSRQAHIARRIAEAFPA